MELKWDECNAINKESLIFNDLSACKLSIGKISSTFQFTTEMYKILVFLHFYGEIIWYILMLICLIEYFQIILIITHHLINLLDFYPIDESEFEFR